MYYEFTKVLKVLFPIFSLLSFCFFFTYFQGPTSSSSDIILTVSQQVVGLHPEKENREKETTLATNKLTPVSRVQNQLSTASSAPTSPMLQPNHQSCDGSGKSELVIQQKKSDKLAQIQPLQLVQQQQQNQINKFSEHQNQLKQHQQQKHVPTGGIANPQNKVKARKETLEAKRERKAAKTLAIITGAFVVCWLPFFLMALLLPLCGDTCEINDKVAALFLWLGYFNSTLNPVIYTIFSPEFRQAFKRILFGTHRTGYYRGGKL